jgi:pimeloyl-ACP methyl ester carboxylesterase
VLFWIIPVAAIILIVLVICWKLSGIVVRPKTSDPDKCYNEAAEKGEFNKTAYENEWNKEDFFLTSPYGYKLSCTFIPRKRDMVPEDGRERAVVIVHGYTYCKVGSIKYAEMFRELGFNCIIYDHRNHGYSGKAPTTMGYYEAYDLKLVCDWAREKLGENAVVGTHGESMGAATVMMNIPLDDKLAFAAEDCGYSSLSEQLAYNMKTQFHLPRYPFLAIASLFSKLRGGVLFGAVTPMKEVAKCKDVPVLFIHGEEDDFVPFSMINEVYNAKTGIKLQKTYPGAKHLHPGDANSARSDLVHSPDHKWVPVFPPHALDDPGRRGRMACRPFHL